MNRSSRFAAAALVLLLALCPGACGPATGRELVSACLGLDVSHTQEAVYTDSHGGWQGDGLTHIVLNCPDDGLRSQLERDSRWLPLPMDATAAALLAHVDGEALSALQRGHYRLVDRQEEPEVHILDRYSFNFTLGIYDSDGNTLHYFALDT